MPTYQYELTSRQNQQIIDRARADYIWKGELKNEGTQRLDMWYQPHVGGIITPGAFQQLRSITEDTIRREVSYRASALAYREILIRYASELDPYWVTSQIENIDKNIGISTSDQEIEIESYQIIEKQYMLQGETAGKLISGGGLLLLTIAGLGILREIFTMHSTTKT